MIGTLALITTLSLLAWCRPTLRPPPAQPGCIRAAACQVAHQRTRERRLARAMLMEALTGYFTIIR
jgi:hypothetical protein